MQGYLLGFWSLHGMASQAWVNFSLLVSIISADIYHLLEDGIIIFSHNPLSLVEETLDRALRKFVEYISHTLTSM